MKIVIFAGGYGSRMWPISRKSNPKQFCNIVKGKTFFQNMLSIYLEKYSPSDILVSTEARYIDFVKSQAPQIPVENIILEPERKDSLGAIGLATAVVEKLYPGEIIFLSWSDHFFAKKGEFLKMIAFAEEYAKESGRPVLINEKPTYASVHNGWIELSEAIAEREGYPVYEIKRFVEKPDSIHAQEYLNAGNFLIHTGYGAWKATSLLEYYKTYRPNEYEGLVKIMDAWDTPQRNSVLATEYAKFEKQSVEFGLFEKLPRDLRVTLASDTGWEDAGTWELFYKAMKEEGMEDVVEGDITVKKIDSKNNLIIGSHGKLITLIGVENLAIIDTGDALLVSSLGKTDKVKEVFKTLEEELPKFVD